MIKIDLQQLTNEIKTDNIREIETEQIHDMAIIGMAVKLPYAEDLNQFWENLKNGKDCITELPANRKSEADRYLSYIRKKASGTKYKKGSYIDGIDEFDYMYFNISHREASLMDPNQRMFLEIALSAVEDAGYGGDKLKGSKTGVYFGFVSDMAYQRFIADVEPSSLGMSISGNMASLIPGRVSYILDLKGPSMLIDTACSSSLVAIHTACHAIQKGDCDLAIVGSSKISLLPIEDDNMLGIESKSYICRAFDEEADGTCMGEGVMALVLKPLSAAIKDRDHIYAVIKGTAVNQDGTSMGITAPNALAQAEVIKAAWQDAGIDPETITYIEAHGTGTKLGDPIEIDGISKAFSKYTNKKQFCAVGSVKTNLGHLDSAAGMVGLIKAVLALKYKQIPPSLHFNKSNPNIDFENSPVYVNNKLIDWEPSGSPRRCGVSAFGLSGTNCHVVLEEAPAVRDNPNNAGAHLFTLSAKSGEVLKKLIEKYLNLLKSNEGINLGNLCYTVNTGRGAYSHRLGIITDNITDLWKKLDFIIHSELATYEEQGIFYNKISATLSDNQEKNPSKEAIATELTAVPNERVDRLKSRDNINLNEICRLYIQGFDVNWDDLYKKGEYRRLSLPTYPFERRRCWVELPSDFNIATGGNKQCHHIEGTEENQNEAQPSSPVRQEKRLTNFNANQPANEEERPHTEELLEDTDVTNSIETVIRQAWRDVLGIVEIGRHDDFFDLGGDSLKAVQVIAKMKNYGLTLEDLIKYPTVAGLAEFTAKRHSYIEPEKLPPHLEKNLEIEYFFAKDGSIDPLAKNMDCSVMMFYYNLKRYFPNYTDYSLIFFDDTSFNLTINPEGVLYNIEVNSFSEINDLYQADIRKGEGFQSISAIEELLDQEKLPIIKTYTKKLPFHKNFISFDFEVTDTPEDLAKDVHTFMAVAYDPEMLYYVEMPYVLNSNFIPYAKNKSVGVVKKDDLKHAFNVEIYYATIDIKVDKLSREIDLKEKISLITSNSAQPVKENEGYKTYSGVEALDVLMEFCRKETLFLTQENLYYNGYDIKKLFEWKLWVIVSRRMQLKQILIGLKEKYPNISKYEIIPAIDTAIEAWRGMIGLISEKYERKEYLFGKEYLKNLDAIKEAEQKLIQKLSVI